MQVSESCRQHLPTSSDGSDLLAERVHRPKVLHPHVGRISVTNSFLIRFRYHRYVPITASNVDEPDLHRGVALFHGLADRTRLAIVRQLADGERRVVDLTTALGLAQGTVSGHLACLRECGLIVGRPEGRQVFYALAHPELFDLLSSAERLLALTGDAVELCPNFGDPAAFDDSTSPTIQERTR